MKTLPTEHSIALHYAESMKLFEKDGKIAFGKWRSWLRAKSKEEADEILKSVNPHLTDLPT